MSSPFYYEGLRVLGESGLPEGPPAQKGVAIDPGIPGTKTYVKPLDDSTSQPKEGEPSGRDLVDILREKGRTDENSPYYDTSYMGLGPSDNSKTKYPYRDGIPNRHNASARFAVHLWLLSKTSSRYFRSSEVVRVAATQEEVLSNLSGKVTQKASACTATLKRADTKNLRWTFSVDCGNGPKAVKVKAIRPRKNVTAFGKLELQLACSCPAWQWLGPEYHAKGQKYLLGKPRGTATTPDVRDPDRVNKVCKHVAAALLVTKGWKIPKK
jgi:hypothetical protein